MHSCIRQTYINAWEHDAFLRKYASVYMYACIHVRHCTRYDYVCTCMYGRCHKYNVLKCIITHRKHTQMVTSTRVLDAGSRTYHLGVDGRNTNGICYSTFLNVKRCKIVIGLRANRRSRLCWLVTTASNARETDKQTVRQSETDRQTDLWYRLFNNYIIGTH